MNLGERFLTNMLSDGRPRPPLSSDALPSLLFPSAGAIVPSPGRAAAAAARGAPADSLATAGTAIVSHAVVYSALFLMALSIIVLSALSIAWPSRVPSRPHTTKARAT